MTGHCRTTALLALALAAAEAAAQRTPVTPTPPGTPPGRPTPRPTPPATGTFRPSPRPGGGAGTTSVTVNKYYSRRYVLAPGWYGFGYPSITSQVTVFYAAPAFVLTPRDPLDDLPPDLLPRPRPPAPEPLDPPGLPEAPAPPAPLPGKEAGVFRPLEPDNRERATRPLPPDAEPAPTPEPPLPPRPPRPAEVDPRPEGVRLVDDASTAFRAGEYGRAAGFLRRTIAAAPDDARPRFLLVQVLTALGKYREAADAAQAAAVKFPDWPARPFRPLDLYGGNDAEHAAHREQLDDALARHPDDPVLLFLSGHALWFDGKRDEAVARFRRAANPAGAVDPAAIGRFLSAAAGS